MKEHIFGEVVVAIMPRPFLVACSPKISESSGKAINCTVGQAHFYKVENSPVEISFWGRKFYLKVDKGKVDNVTEGDTGRAVVVYHVAPAYSEGALKRISTDLEKELKKHGRELLHSQINKHSVHNALPVIFML